MGDIEGTNIIWDGKLGKLKAKLKFSRSKPRCHNCKNPNKRMCVEVSKRKGGSYYGAGLKTMSLCTECLQKLVEGVNEAVKQHRVLRTILSGMGAGDIVNNVSSEDKAAATEDLRKCLAELFGRKE